MFQEFNKQNKKNWLDKVTVDLKGKDISSLNWKLDDIDMTPFFHQEDNNQSSPISSRTENQWEIGSRIFVNQFKGANKEALRALNGGANALYFQYDKSISKDDLYTLLENIHVDWISTSFQCTEGQLDVQFLETVLDFGKKAQYSLDKTKFSFDCSITDLNKLTPYFTIFSSSSFFNVNGLEISRASESLSDEIAEILHQANAILNALDDQKIDAKLWNNLVQFNILLDDRYFINITKIRALKILWSLMQDAWDVDLQDPNINVHIHPDSYSEDENLNKIKASLQSMSGIIGGINKLFIYPSDDKTNHGGSAFSQRIALNINHILQQESYLDLVVDPSQGSYFIEELTNRLAENAWSLFQAKL